MLISKEDGRRLIEAVERPQATSQDTSDTSEIASLCLCLFSLGFAPSDSELTTISFSCDIIGHSFMMFIYELYVYYISFHDL